MYFGNLVGAWDADVYCGFSSWPQVRMASDMVEFDLQYRGTDAAFG